MDQYHQPKMEAEVLFTSSRSSHIYIPKITSHGSVPQSTHVISPPSGGNEHFWPHAAALANKDLVRTNSHFAKVQGKTHGVFKEVSPWHIDANWFGSF
jgi:hypothetical protein